MDSDVAAWSTRRRLIPWLAGAAGAALVAVAATDALAAILALLVCSGGCAMAYLVTVQAEFVEITTDSIRGHAIGIAAAGMIASQGACLVLAGVLAELVGSR